MKATDDGGPAFPTENEHQTGPNSYHYGGMSLRDYFAAKAMAAWIGTHVHPDDVHPVSNDCHDSLARLSYEMADAMLAARQALATATK